MKIIKNAKERNTENIYSLYLSFSLLCALPSSLRFLSLPLSLSLSTEKERHEEENPPLSLFRLLFLSSHVLPLSPRFLSLSPATPSLPLFLSSLPSLPLFPRSLSRQLLRPLPLSPSLGISFVLFLSLPLFFLSRILSLSFSVFRALLSLPRSLSQREFRRELLSSLVTEIFPSQGVLPPRLFPLSFSSSRTRARKRERGRFPLPILLPLAPFFSLPRSLSLSSPSLAMEIIYVARGVLSKEREMISTIQIHLN